MADGYAPRPLIEPGVYLDLDMRDYLADPAIGGHGARVLAASPCDWRWERPDNVLHREPKQSDARKHGTMIHTAILDGMEEYARRYVVAPDKRAHPGALDTVADLRGWLKAHNETTEKDDRVKLTGARDELIERVRENGGGALIWDDIEAALTKGRTVVSADDDRYVRIVEGFATNAYAHLLDGGLSEVSVFWEEDGVRFKARLDRITPTRVVDLKKFGMAPKVGDALRTHLIGEAARHGYAVQAYMHMRAVRWIAANAGALSITARGERVSERMERIDEIARAWADETPLYTWLFLRCPGPPMGKPITFRPTSAMWSKAQAILADALDNYRRFKAEHGDKLWMDAQSEEDEDDEDWPLWAFRTPLEDGGEIIL